MEGGRIADCAEPAWKCCTACVEHSSQALVPLVVQRLWNQIDRARFVSCASCHMGPMNLYTKFCLLNWSHMQWSATGDSLAWSSHDYFDQSEPSYSSAAISYPHVSMSSLSMLIAATGRCQCPQIWTWEFVMLKQPITAQLAIVSRSISMVKHSTQSG